MTEYKARIRHWTGTGTGTSLKNQALHDQAAPVLEAAVKRLAEFDTSDEVAGFLKAEGIKGMIGISSQCPVANWIRRETGYQVRVASTISVPWDGSTTVLECPYATFEFYNRFDNHRYPELQEPDKYGRVLAAVNPAD